MTGPFLDIDEDLINILHHRGIEAAISFAQTRIFKELEEKGTVLSQEVNEFVVRAAYTEVKNVTYQIRKSSLPEGFAHLFEIQTKKEAKRFAESDLVIQDSDFVKLIMNAELFGFHHTRKHREFIPEHLRDFDPKDIGPTEPGTNRLTKKGRKSLSKLSALFAQRRQLNVHWFQFGLQWHCFYFDISDLMKGHWIAGDHIHYVSYLWGIPGDEIWKGFDSRSYSPANAHIRYIHNLRDR